MNLHQCTSDGDRVNVLCNCRRGQDHDESEFDQEPDRQELELVRLPPEEVVTNVVRKMVETGDPKVMAWGIAIEDAVHQILDRES